LPNICLVKTRTDSGFANRFQNTNSSDSGHISGIFWNIEAHADVALRPEVIDFVRLQFIKQLHQIHRVREIAVVQEQPHAVNVRIDIKMIDASGVEGARPPDYSVNLVAFFQQQIGQITSILAGDPGDQGALHLASGIKSNRACEQIIVAEDGLCPVPNI
jgi:hypothetical protein